MSTRSTGVQPAGRAVGEETPLALRRFEVRDFSHALLRRTREPALDRQRRHERAVHEPLAVLLGVPDDRNQIPAVSRPGDVRCLPVWKSLRGMHRLEHRLILLLGSILPKVCLQICYGVIPSVSFRLTVTGSGALDPEPGYYVRAGCLASSADLLQQARQVEVVMRLPDALPLNLEHLRGFEVDSATGWGDVARWHVDRSGLAALPCEFQRNGAVISHRPVNPPLGIRE